MISVCASPLPSGRGAGGEGATAPGRLIAVVGASGVGKDSVMAGLAAAEPRLACVRRVITRPADPGGEPFEPVAGAEFATRVAMGEFCLSWQAHGLSYGIPRTLADEIAGGADRLVNLSRAVLPEAAGLFPGLTVLRITAAPETLAARLAARGRETPDDIARRLARASAPLPADLPSSVPVLAIANDGELTDTIAAARAALFPDTVPSQDRRP